MCLPFGLMSPQQQPIVGLTPKGSQLKQTMQVILGVHFLLSIVKMFIIGFGPALNDLISCLILFCGVSQHNFCHILMYMIFNIFGAFFLFTLIGFYIQSGSIENTMIQGNAEAGLFIGFSIVMFLFYLFSIYFSFQTYKEFKGMLQDQTGMSDPLSGGFGMGNPIQYGSLQSDEANRGYSGGQQEQAMTQQQQSRFQAFGGQGKRLGDY